LPTLAPSSTSPFRRGERNAQRLKLNADLKAWVKQQQAAGNWSVYILDLEKQMNWFAMNEAQRKALFDDGLHFTENGYSVLGGYIADGLRKVLKI
jgi:lysophospholipase L1-like esterase